MKKAARCLLLSLGAVFFLCSFSALANMTEPQSGEPDKGKKVLFGVGEPLVMMGVTSDKGSGSFSAAEYLLDAMNFGAIREWMHVTDILDSPSSPDESAVRKSIPMRWTCMPVWGLKSPA